MTDYRQLDRELLEQQREAEADMVTLFRLNNGVPLCARTILSSLARYQQFIVRRALWSLCDADILTRTPEGFKLLHEDYS